jgi:hypothetical protein
MSLQLAIALGVCGQLVAGAMAAGSAALLFRLLRWLDAGAGGGEADSGGGGGGSGDRPAEPPPDGDDGTHPAWWPQFERQFAEHVERSQPARRS